jgi:type VI secretion system protein ImpK
MRLYAAIEPGRGALPELSTRWRGAQLHARRVPGALAIWGAASACASFLAALYFGFSVLLGTRSDPVARELARLKLPPLAMAASQPRRAPGTAVSAASLTLAKALGEAVQVSDLGDGTLMVLKSDHLFAPGSARPAADEHALIEQIAAALDTLPGAIIVSGHTDDQPIRTARFPSNWELSTERARSVVSIMAGKLGDATRLRAEGLADSDPLVPNDSAANRAKNRRVTIVLRSGS